MARAIWYCTRIVAARKAQDNSGSNRNHGRGATGICWGRRNLSWWGCVPRSHQQYQHTGSRLGIWTTGRSRNVGEGTRPRPALVHPTTLPQRTQLLPSRLKTTNAALILAFAWPRGEGPPPNLGARAGRLALAPETVRPVHGAGRLMNHA